MANLKNLKVLHIGGVDYNVGFSTNDLTDDLLSKLNGIAAGAQVNVIESIKLNGAEIAVSEKMVDLGNLQKTLTPGSGISIAADGTISTTLDVEAFKVVDELPDAPAAGNESKIHVVPNASGAEGNMYNEYLWDGSNWELLGSFKADVDLSDYAKTADVNAAIEAAQTALQTNIDKKVAQSDYDTKIGEIEGAASTLKGRVDTIEGDYLTSADETELQGKIDAKVAQTVYDAYVAANDAAVQANTTKLAGISNGANKVSTSYNEGTATLTITIE